MRKLLVVLASVAFILGLALPTMAASLKISGEYDFTVAYQNGDIGVDDSDANQLTPTTNIVDFSTLYLTLDYGDADSLMVAHIPLELTATSAVTGVTPVENPQAIDVSTTSGVLTAALADKYWLAYNGDPLKLSLSNVDPKTDSPYAFQSFGDPLGLVKTLDGATTTFKAVGAPLGIGVTGYVIDYNADDDDSTTDTNEAADVEYELLRLTYGLPGGYTIGAIYGQEATAQNTTGDTIKTGAEMVSRPERYIRNIALDLNGPLPVSEGATLTAAAASSQIKEYDAATDTTATDWSDSANAYLLSVKDIKLGAFTVAGDVKAVDKKFEAVAPETDSDLGESPAYEFQGQTQVKGSVSAPFELIGKSFTLTVTDEYRTNYNADNPAIDSWNQATAEIAFSPIDKLTTTIGGSYKSYLDDALVANYVDENGVPYDVTKQGDYIRSVYGKADYQLTDTVKLTGEARYTGAAETATAGNGTGSGVELVAGVEATPIPGVKANGSLTYATGKYDFIDDDANHVLFTEDKTRIVGDFYVEAKQSFQPAVIKGADVVLASGAQIDNELDPYIIGYGEGNISITDRLSTKAAVLYGKSTDHTGDDGLPVLMKILYAGVDYGVSPNSTVSLAYSTSNDSGNIYAAYKVALGSSTVTVSYGETRLGDPCTGDYDADKPWAWLCTISDESTREGLYKVSVTIPF